MKFLTDYQLRELKHFATVSDMEIRGDLARGFIKDENDYTSNFVGALRRNINAHSRSGLSATSVLLTHGQEREWGADAAIILTRDNWSKVAIFEAKWPHFETPDYDWDHTQTSTGLSHYSDQLARQKKWLRQFAVFEMFYNEYDFGQGPGFLDLFGSSCVWHKAASAFNRKRPKPKALWTQDELKNLLRQKRLSIGDVMDAFGKCKQGKLFQIVDPEVIGREFNLPRQILAIKAREENQASRTK